MKHLYSILMTILTFTFFCVAGIQTIRYEREAVKRKCRICIMSEREVDWLHVEWIKSKGKEDLKKGVTK